jgi:anti-anti-sigma regulatory factor
MTMEEGMRVEKLVGKIEGAMTLALSGDSGLSYAGELRETLADALATARDLTVDAAAVTDADVSTVQLLCAAHRTAVKLGKHLELLSISEAISRVVRDTGFLRREGRMQDPDRNCLWLEGGREWPSGL